MAKMFDNSGSRVSPTADTAASLKIFYDIPDGQ